MLGMREDNAEGGILFHSRRAGATGAFEAACWRERSFAEGGVGGVVVSGATG